MSAHLLKMFLNIAVSQNIEIHEANEWNYYAQSKY